MPAEIVAVDTELLRVLAAEAVVTAPPAPSRQPVGTSEFSLEAWLGDHGIRFRPAGRRRREPEIRFMRARLIRSTKEKMRRYFAVRTDRYGSSASIIPAAVNYGRTCGSCMSRDIGREKHLSARDP